MSPNIDLNGLEKHKALPNVSDDQVVLLIPHLQEQYLSQHTSLLSLSAYYSYSVYMTLRLKAYLFISNRICFRHNNKAELSSNYYFKFKVELNSNYYLKLGEF